MKKISFLVFFLALSAVAQQSQYLLGVRNTKYVSIGTEINNKWGIVIENSIFTEPFEYQYTRIVSYYNYTLPLEITGYYAIFYGIQHNIGFYDIGSILDLKWNILKKLLQLQGTLQPYYDSDLKMDLGYLTSLQIKPLSEIGVRIGFKNLPECRETEQRFFFDLVFDVSHMQINPEISIPTNDEYSATRFNISFLYKNFFF